MILGIEKADKKVNIINLGTSETIEVFDSIKVITEFMGINPKIIAQDSTRGWVGDSPMIYLDTTKMNSYGWEPSVSIRDGIVKTLEWLRGSEWLLKGASKRNL
jgi:UDP-glucose 4-epimerase